jgi:uncharacterized membrane protein HdeD (DUF308 family)
MAYTELRNGILTILGAGLGALILGPVMALILIFFGVAAVIAFFSHHVEIDLKSAILLGAFSISGSILLAAHLIAK